MTIDKDFKTTLPEFMIANVRTIRLREIKV